MELAAAQDTESLRPETERAGLFEFDNASELYSLIIALHVFSSLPVERKREIEEERQRERDKERNEQREREGEEREMRNRKNNVIYSW